MAFTDDDCVPSPAWLRALPELFDDPAVAAVTGPAFAHSLDDGRAAAVRGLGRVPARLGTPQLRLDEHAPPAAGQIGAGADMIFRRSVLDALGDAFPPELDAGTPTESGGDMYALYKVLAAAPGRLRPPHLRLPPAPPRRRVHAPDDPRLRRRPDSAVLTKMMGRGARARGAGRLAVAVAPVCARCGRPGGEGAGRSRSPPGSGGTTCEGGVGQGRAGGARREAPPAAAGRAADRPPEPGRADPRPARRPAPAGAAAPWGSVISRRSVGRERSRAASARAAPASAQDRVPLEVVLVDDAPAGAAGCPSRRARADLACGRSRTESGGRARPPRATPGRRRPASCCCSSTTTWSPSRASSRRHLERHARRGRAGDRGGVLAAAARRRGLAATAAPRLWWEDHFRGKRDAAD